MKKILSKVGLCAAIVIGSMSHQAFAVERVFQGLTVTPPTAPAVTANATLDFPNIASGQYHWLHALTITNNDTANSVTVTILRNSNAVTGAINVAAGGTQQIMFTDGFQIRQSDTMEVKVGSTGYPASATSNVDLTFDMK